MKKIQINEINYDVCCNAWTRILYKQTFKHGIFEDLGKAQEFADALDNADEDKRASIALSKMDDFLDVILQITYIEILTSNPKFQTYEEWLKSLPNIDLSQKWVEEVLEIASNCFRG